MESNSPSRFWHDRIDIWLPAALGVAGLLLLVFLAEKHETPTAFQARIYLTLLALSGAAFAAVIPGLLNISVTAAGIAVRAAGALAVFVLVFFYEPAHENLAKTLHVQIDPEPPQVFVTELIRGPAVRVLSGGGPSDTCGSGRDNKVTSCVQPQHAGGSLVKDTVAPIELQRIGNVTGWKVTTDSPTMACIEFRAATGACQTLISITGRVAALEKFPAEPHKSR